MRPRLQLPRDSDLNGKQEECDNRGPSKMRRESGGPCLSAVFVDYDNIYLSLKRKSEEAAKRFAKDASAWLRAIETGRLITATNTPFSDIPRRIVMNRCYGNPVPRRNAHDNSTDMNSFPFVRHHFLRAGFEVIDCPPLTAQLKNSSDIRMVMDVRDYLTHDTYFDEFIILSGDADFTPVLHRLRAHARRTVIFANDFTAAPYTAISDGEVREADLIALILNGALPDEVAGEAPVITPSAKAEETRREIVAEVVAGVRASAAPVPLEALADRALRALGHEKTIATGWAGAGSFFELLRQQLPQDIKLTKEPPYLAFDAKRHGEDGAATALEAREPVWRSRPAARRRRRLPPHRRCRSRSPAPLTAEPFRRQGQGESGRAPAPAPAAVPAPTTQTAAPPPPPPLLAHAARRQLGCHSAVDRPHPGCLPGPAVGAARVPAAVRGDGQGDQRQRPDRRPDAGQHHPARAGAGPWRAPRRRALRARGGERGRPLVRAGRLGQPVRRPLPQLRGREVPRPGPQPVGRRARPDRCLVRRRHAAATADDDWLPPPLPRRPMCRRPPVRWPRPPRRRRLQHPPAGAARWWSYDDGRPQQPAETARTAPARQRRRAAKARTSRASCGHGCAAIRQPDSIAATPPPIRGGSKCLRCQTF